MRRFDAPRSEATHGETSHGETTHGHATSADTTTGVVGRANDVSDRVVSIVSYLIAGPLTMGAIGYGLDRWLGTRVLVAVGVVLGIALSLYIVRFRYGTNASAAPIETISTSPSTTPDEVASHRPGSDAARTTNEESQ